MTRISSFLTVVTSIVLLATSASAIEICGKAKRYTCVVDGDTIWLKGEKIRLMGYDTPETTTAFCGGDTEKQLGYKATERLQELLTNNNFTVHRDGKDRYGGHQLAELGPRLTAVVTVMLHLGRFGVVDVCVVAQ